MSGSGRPAEQLAVVQLLGREGHGDGEDDAADAVGEAVFQKDVPPRVEMIFGFSVGMSPQRNFGGSLRTMFRSGK